MTSLYGAEHELASWAHGYELWRRRAVAAEAERDQLMAALRQIEIALTPSGGTSSGPLGVALVARDIARAAIAKARM